MSSNEMVVSLDVGGTTVDAACFSRDGEIIGEKKSIGSPSKGIASRIVNDLALLINTVNGLSGYQSIACGIGIPGPFDCETGDSGMDHKFKALKEEKVNLLRPLEKYSKLPVHFLKDSVAFGLGVSEKQLPNTSRLIVLPLGTGLGSCFIENGQIIENDDRVPKDGELWDLPYNGTKLEEKAVSGPTIAAIFKAKTGGVLDAEAIAALARNGDLPAADTYREAGEALGHGLAPFYESFKPEKIVIGGKVARSIDLFGPVMERVLAGTELNEPLVIPAASEDLALYGTAKYAFSKLNG